MFKLRSLVAWGGAKYMGEGINVDMVYFIIKNNNDFLSVTKFIQK